MALPERTFSLFSLFQNSIVSHQICPYLQISSLLKLAATSKSFRSLIFESPDAFRYLDLSTTKGATVDLAPIDRGGTIWRNQRVDESTTEEDFYSGPLRGIFSFFRRSDLLSNVRTLILDGQSAPAEILREIICENDFQVQILSVVAAKNLNQKKFQQLLRYAVRPSRAEDPRVKGIYVFGTRSRFSIEELPEVPSNSVTDSPGAQLGVALSQKSHKAVRSPLHAQANLWYRNSGKVLLEDKDLSSWGDTLKACQGIIYFDAVLCRGPKHEYAIAGSGEVRRDWTSPCVASIALKGCEICHSLPEGHASSMNAPSERLPLLSPIPKRSLSIKNAQKPHIPSGLHWSEQQALFARCLSCCDGRWCEGCGRFWCEDHYDSRAAAYTHGNVEIAQATGGDPKVNLKRECFDCGRLCDRCNGLRQKRCKHCRGEFCLYHYTGSTADTCDWCQRSGRRTRELY